jgi:hypothetical protein
VKKTLATLIAIATIASAAVAGEVYDRTGVLTLSTNGLYSWTNTVQNANLELKRIDILGMDFVTDTVTVQRVTGDTKKQTNTVCGVLAASNYGSSNLVVAAGSGPVYLKAGDILKFTSGMGSNGSVQVEYLNLQH